MRTVDGNLSKRAQAFDRSALVYREEAGGYTLERKGLEPLSLGDSFGRAQSALEALKVSHVATDGPAPRDPD